MRTFQALAAVFAVLVLVRQGRAALALLAAGRETPEPGAPGRLAGVVPLLACLAAAAVLAAAVKALLADHLISGATP